MRYINLVRDTEDGLEGFGEYLDENASKSEAYGIKKSTLDNMEDHFSETLDWCNTEGKFIKSIDAKTVKKNSKINKKAENFCKWAKLYLKAQSGYFETGQRYYLYFMYFVGNKEPQLGRAIIEIEDNFFAKCDNLASGRTYRGKFGRHTGHYVFELKAVGPESSSLHIKVGYFKPEDDKILVGAYITFEEGHVVTGSLVLEHCDDEKAKPMALSWFNHSEAFSKVDKSIKRYLSVRKLSYHKAPNNKTTTDLLDEFIFDYTEDWTNRFFELDKPVTFIAFQINSVSSELAKNDIHDMVEKVVALKREYSDSIEFEFFDSRLASPDNKGFYLQRSLKILTRTRLFVIILTETNQHSLSLVQLGWAIAHCKKVIVLYKEGSVSETFKSLVYLSPESKKVKVEMVSFVNNAEFEKGLQTIRFELTRTLNMVRLPNE